MCGKIVIVEKKKTSTRSICEAVAELMHTKLS